MHPVLRKFYQIRNSKLSNYPDIYQQIHKKYEL